MAMRCAAGHYRLGLLLAPARRASRLAFSRGAASGRWTVRRACSISSSCSSPSASSFSRSAYPCRVAWRRGSRSLLSPRPWRRPRRSPSRPGPRRARFLRCWLRRGTMGCANGPPTSPCQSLSALFRVTGPAMNVAVVIFVANTLGMQLSAGGHVAGIAVASIASISGARPARPGQLLHARSRRLRWQWACPLRRWAFDRGRDRCPDIFRTVGNVTMDVAVDRSGRSFRPRQPQILNAR